MTARRRIDNTTPPRRLPAFLGEPARQEWLAIARLEVLDTRWVLGRQGTGYEKLDLVSALSEGALEAHRPFVESQVAAARSSLGVDSSLGWDAYLLRYGAGAFVPEHRDPTSTLHHLRLNALLQAGSSGTGRLELDGELWDLAEGDAVVFRPDVMAHQVSRVEGERLVLSVGCVFTPPGPSAN